MDPLTVSHDLATPPLSYFTQDIIISKFVLLSISLTVILSILRIYLPYFWLIYWCWLIVLLVYWNPIVDLLIDWLIYWLLLLIFWLVGILADLQFDFPTGILLNWNPGWLVYLLVGPLVKWFFYWLVSWSNGWCIGYIDYLPGYWLIYL